MSEKMLVTQALDERDLLVKKIADKIAKASFVDTIKPNEDKVFAKRTSKEEYAKEAESAYQQITDLIDRFQKIDAAIVASNANMEITTSYGIFTVAGAIALRSRLRGAGAYGGDADFEGRLQKKLPNISKGNTLPGSMQSRFPPRIHTVPSSSGNSFLRSSTFVPILQCAR